MSHDSIQFIIFFYIICFLIFYCCLVQIKTDDDDDNDDVTIGLVCVSDSLSVSLISPVSTTRVNSPS